MISLVLILAGVLTASVGVIIAVKSKFLARIGNNRFRVIFM